MNLDNIMQWFYGLGAETQFNLQESWETAVSEQNCRLDFDEYLLDNYAAINEIESEHNDLLMP